jgi:hypothetical protein
MTARDDVGVDGRDLPPLSAYQQDERLGKANGAEPAQGAAPPLRLQTLQEFVTRPEGSSQIRGIDPGHAIVVFFGPPKEGKTFSVCDLTMHAAHGLDWHGHRVRKALRVAYLIGEGIQGFKVRLRGWLEHHDSIEQTGEFRIFPAPLSLPDCIDLVTGMLAPFKPDIVVADTLNAYFGPGDENATKDMTAFCSAVRTLRDSLRCSVYVIHHTGHGSTGRERGSIVLRASADVLVQIAKDENSSGLVGFQVITGRDIEAMVQPIALRLNRYETEWTDEDGEPMVTCVVQGADTHVTLPGRGGPPLGPAQAAVLQAAKDLARGQTPDGNGEVILARSDIAARAKATADISRQSVSSAWTPLAKRKLLRLIEPGSVAVRVRP